LVADLLVALLGSNRAHVGRDDRDAQDLALWFADDLE
jgi:hypothetical protein